MAQVRFHFKTKEEADAFVEGVEYVNDSAVEVENVQAADTGWVVTIWDADKE